MEFRDRNVMLKDDDLMDSSIRGSILYGGWFLTRDDAKRLEDIAREVLDAPLSTIKTHESTIVAECGHLTHSFCGKDPDKQHGFYQHLTEKMPASISLQLIGLSYTMTQDHHFISAFVPDPSFTGLTTNDHAHITALRLKTTPAVQSNAMLANADGATRFLRFPEPIPVMLYAGAVVTRKPQEKIVT
jgi:hypothetical protein